MSAARMGNKILSEYIKIYSFLLQDLRFLASMCGKLVGEKTKMLEQ